MLGDGSSVPPNKSTGDARCVEGNPAFHPAAAESVCADPHR